MTGKTLIIVESPSKATKIQQYLGDNYIVLASKGHIADLAKGGKHGFGVDIQNGFKPKYVLMQDKVSTLNELISAAKECDLILLASDPDREGTGISWHLRERLLDCGKPFKRMTFNEIKKDKLLKAIKEAGDIDMDLFHAQEARRILDRLVGFMASPFLLNCFGPNLSAGRVQSVVTRMIIDREEEINSFNPETFWTLSVNLNKDGQKFQTKYHNKILDQSTADSVYKQLSNTTDKFVVSSVLAQEDRKSPPAPLITSSLQQLMSRTHNMAADRTMKAAQSLYECGYCTYIRTDSVRVSDEAVGEARTWLTDNSYKVPKKPNDYKNKDSAQDAHEAIRPSDLSLLPNKNYAIIDSDEKLVYEAIWKYFVASQMEPAVYNTLKVSLQLQSDPSVVIKASGKSLKSKGFLEILGIDDNSKIDIPNLTKGDILSITSKNDVSLDKKQTQPPPRFSEDKLIKELVNKNIGRPATYADLLSKITSRNYVEKKGNVYHATDLGKKITSILKDSFSFMDYNYTALLEKKLDDIEHARVNHIDMLNDFYPKFKSELDKAYIKQGQNICELCGSTTVVRESKKTKERFIGCRNYPKCKFIKNIQVDNK